MANSVPNDWTECEVYRGWTIAVKHYKSAAYKGFRAGAQTASYSSRADARLAIDATEDAFA
jgi:hypothetical protein